MPLGVTAAFNKNLLVRLNRELGADLDPLRFEHDARWNDAERRVEMHLAATRDRRCGSPRPASTCVSEGRDDLDRELPQVLRSRS